MIITSEVRGFNLATIPFFMPHISNELFNQVNEYISEVFRGPYAHL